MADRSVGRRLRGAPAGRPTPTAGQAARKPSALAHLKRQLQQALASLSRRDQVMSELTIYREELQAQNQTLLDTERELSLARDRLSDLFQRAPLPYLTMNSAAVITALNWNAAQLLGRNDDVVGSPFSLFVPVAERPRFRQHLAVCRRKPGPVLIDLMLKVADGTVPVQLSSAVSGDGWIYTAIIDLRDRKRAALERKRLKSSAEAARDASAAKDQFLATLSHELRTPLTPVVAATSALQRLCADAGVESDDLFATIRRNLGYELRLIDDLLDVSRLIHHKLRLDRRDLDLHSVINDAIDQLSPDAATKGLQVERALAAQQPVVRGDADRLRQVFANLVRNAIKFTPAGGRIDISSRNVDGFISVAVQDTGDGLPVEDQLRIFERFVQGDNAKPREGLGLGLPIAHGIVSAHGGHLTVSSAGPGRGSTFEVKLRAYPGRARAPDKRRRRAAPRARPATAERTRPAAKRARAGGIRILFVEDHEDTARMLAQLLERAGYRVTLADSVATALARADGDIEMVVSDIGLPDGSGLDSMRQLNARLGPLPAIALSGYGTREDVRRARAAGFKRHLMKPVELPVLVRAIEDLRTAKTTRARH